MTYNHDWHKEMMKIGCKSVFDSLMLVMYLMGIEQHFGSCELQIMHNNSDQLHSLTISLREKAKEDHAGIIHPSIIHHTLIRMSHRTVRRG